MTATPPILRELSGKRIFCVAECSPEAPATGKIPVGSGEVIRARVAGYTALIRLGNARPRGAHPQTSSTIVMPRGAAPHTRPPSSRTRQRVAARLAGATCSGVSTTPHRRRGGPRRSAEPGPRPHDLRACAVGFGSAATSAIGWSVSRTTRKSRTGLPGRTATSSSGTVIRSPDCALLAGSDHLSRLRPALPPEQPARPPSPPTACPPTRAWSARPTAPRRAPTGPPGRRTRRCRPDPAGRGSG